MQLIDLVEKRRFVGREFLLWLWFESEIFEGEQTTGDLGSFALWLEKQIILSVLKEKSRFSGKAPSATPEAREGLQLGKLPETAYLRLSRGEEDYGFTLKADTLAFSAVTVPSILRDEKHEQFYERMRLVEELEALIESLYGDFLRLRLGAAWNSVVMPAMTEWVHGREVDVDGYRAGRTAALSGKKKKKGAAEAAE